MALTVTYAKRRRIPKSKTLKGTVSLPFKLAFDSSYPSGGEAVTGWNAANVLGVNIQRSGVYDFTYDHVNLKVVAFNTGTGAEVANATDLSALTNVVGELILK